MIPDFFRFLGPFFWHNSFQAALLLFPQSLQLHLLPLSTLMNDGKLSSASFREGGHGVLGLGFHEGDGVDGDVGPFGF